MKNKINLSKDENLRFMEILRMPKQERSNSFWIKKKHMYKVLGIVCAIESGKARNLSIAELETTSRWLLEHDFGSLRFGFNGSKEAKTDFIYKPTSHVFTFLKNVLDIEHLTKGVIVE